MIKHVQQQLPSGIIHCEDHFPNRLMWYCPTLCNHRAPTTTPLTHHFDVFASITTLLHDYTWAFKQWGCVPQAYILPKRKKKFGKGRPIVAFLDTMGRKLWESLADVLQLMTQQACPDSFHQGDGVTNYTTHTNSCVPTGTHNGKG